ncbi:MAG: transposase [Melioribacteraceae bacterium]|nr:transposase [Melioribacteraceae bacterium]
MFYFKRKKRKVIEHIKSNAKQKNIWLEEINGHKEHIHCLISLGKDQSISKVSQLIKGESSKWINDEKLTKIKFSWQDDYWAVSVSESHINDIKDYIRNQEEHHRTKSFTEEVEDFMKKYGWKYISK